MFEFIEVVAAGGSACTSGDDWMASLTGIRRSHYSAWCVSPSHL